MNEPKPYQNDFYYLLKDSSKEIFIDIGQNGKMRYLTIYNGSGIIQGEDAYLYDQYDELVKYGLIEDAEAGGNAFKFLRVQLKSSLPDGLTDDQRNTVDALYYETWEARDAAAQECQRAVAEAEAKFKAEREIIQNVLFVKLSAIERGEVQDE